MKKIFLLVLIVIAISLVLIGCGETSNKIKHTINIDWSSSALNANGGNFKMLSIIGDNNGQYTMGMPTAFLAYQISLTAQVTPEDGVDYNQVSWSADQNVVSSTTGKRVGFNPVTGGRYTISASYQGDSAQIVALAFFGATIGEYPQSVTFKRGFIFKTGEQTDDLNQADIYLSLVEGCPTYTFPIGATVIYQDFPNSPVNVTFEALANILTVNSELNYINSVDNIDGNGAILIVKTRDGGYAKIMTGAVSEDKLTKYHANIYYDYSPDGNFDIHF